MATAAIRRVGRVALSVVVAGLVGCRGRPPATRGAAGGGASDANPVTLSLSLASDHVRSGDLVLADIILTNVSSKPVWVNARLSVNREDDPPPVRSVWILVVGPDGRDVPFECMTQTRAVAAEDYRLLKPGEKVSQEEILPGCYRLEKPGHYKLAGFYQDGNPSPPSPPPNVQFLSQLLQSAPVDLYVTPAVKPGR